VVHGADRFTESIFIDAEVISGIEALEDLAPLHNAPAVDVIHASGDVLATAIPMFAVSIPLFIAVCLRRRACTRCRLSFLASITFGAMGFTAYRTNTSSDGTRGSLVSRLKA
jgi:hypothetical protein